MGYWNTTALRGGTFEEMINMTNDVYRQKGLALIQKVPTPITPMKIDPETSTITLAYFEKKSTVDYLGVAQGVPLCFDAKETARSSFPLGNVHEHQMAFMEAFVAQKGLAFLLVRFARQGEVFCLPYRRLAPLWAVAGRGGRKSIPYDAFDRELIVGNRNGCLVHYLEAVNVMLRQERESERTEGKNA